MASGIAAIRKGVSRWLSDDGLTRKAYLNTAAAALDYGARVVVGFAVNPYLVSGLGTYGFGLWQVLRQLVGYLTPASGRPTQALKWTIANRQASADYGEKRRQVGAAVAVWVVFLPILGSLGALLAWFAPAWLRAPAELAATVRWAAALLVANLVISTLVEIPRSVLAGENRAYKRLGLSTLLVFASGGFTLLALYLETGLVGVAAGPLAIAVLTGLLFLRVARTHVPWFGVARPSREIVWRFASLSGWFLGWRLVTQLMNSSDVVLLARLDSVESVASYSLTKYAPDTMIHLVEMLALGITPGLGGILGAGDLARAQRVRGELMSLTWLIATAVGATILLWNRSFVGLWIGPEHYAGPLPSLLIVAMTMQSVVIRNDAFVIDLTLELRNKVLLGFVAALLSIVSAGILVGSFGAGIPGLCAGLMAGRLILSIAYPWMVGQILGLSSGAQWRAAIRPLGAGALLVSAALAAERFAAASGWLALVAGVAVTFGGVACLAFALGLAAEQRARIRERVAGALRSKAIKT
jgi:O-antigen/teichoic acid export membrane protein